MKAIRITDERMDEVLPSEIKNTNVLSDNAKKTLAAIMNYYLLLEEVKANGYVFLNNETLRQSVGIKKNYVLSAVQELIESDLIERQTGRRRVEGERPMASIYKVKWSNLTKPIKKKNTFEELFSEFLKPSETPLGTTVTDTVSVKVSDIVEEKEIVEDEGPNNLKELNDYFIKRIEKETKGKDLSVDDLNSLETKLEAELEEEFSYIPSYRNIVYLIQSAIEKKREKLLSNQFDFALQSINANAFK